MKRRLLQLAALLPFTWTALLAAQTAATQPSPTLSPQEVFQRVSPSVFVVEALDSQGKVVAFGSGVAVAPNQVVTNQHVVEDGIRVRVRRGQQTWMAVVTHANAGQDLCRLRVEGLQARPAEVRNSVGLAVGERVYAIGAPQGLELTFSEGVISALRDMSTGRIIQTTAPISKGSSGGGLFDARGKLVGVTTLMLLEGQNLNFALPGEWITAIGGSPVPPDHSRESRPGNQQVLLWFVRGSEHLEKGEYGQALQAFREAIRLQPDSALAWYSLGFTYGQLKQYDQALQAYREAIRLKPDDADAWNSLGNTYRNLKQHDQALQALREAIRLKPDDADAWYNLGNTYGQLKQYDQAVQALREAIRLKPDDADAWYNLGVIHWLQANRSGVMQVYERLKKLDSDRAAKFFNKFVLP